MNSKVKAIADYYKKTAQEDKLIEEMSELTKQIMKNRYNKFDEENTLSEIADVCLMLDQFIYLNKLKNKEIDEKIYLKIERTLERIDKKVRFVER